VSVDAIQAFVSELKEHFAPLKHGSAEAEARWLRRIVDALRGSSPIVLSLTAKRLIEHRTNRYFPLIGEIRKACREAAEEAKFDEHIKTLPTLRANIAGEWSDERCKLAYDLTHTELGRQAAREGWILTLWHHCRKHQKLPQSEAEKAACKKAAREFDQVYAECERGGWPQAGKLAELGAHMLAKREKLRAEVLGGRP